MYIYIYIYLYGLPLLVTYKNVSGCKAYLASNSYIGIPNPLFHIFKSRKYLPQVKELIDS